MNSKLELSHKINKYAVLSIIFTLLIFTALIGYILSIINIVLISTTDWENSELNQSKGTYTAASIVCLILLTPIVPAIINIVWASKCKSAIEAKVWNN